MGDKMWNKENALIKIWNVIYPILVYYAVSNVVMYFVMLALGITENTYSANYTMLQTIATAVAIPIILGYYHKDKLLCTVFHQRIGEAFRTNAPMEKVKNAVLTFVCGALVGIVLNNIIGATGLTELSSAYQEVTTHFFSGDVLFEIIGVGILIPIIEELLYRGIVYARLTDWIGIGKAAFISALIFGGLHFNIVQFIYAFLIGILLVYFYEKTYSLLGAVLGHIGANLITILRTEYGILDWMEGSTVMYWGCTVLLAVICILLIGVIHKSSGEKKI